MTAEAWRDVYGAMETNDDGDGAILHFSVPTFYFAFARNDMGWNSDNAK
jgi:hypothetical protein